jgi:hypothetical protein
MTDRAAPVDFASSNAAVPAEPEISLTTYEKIDRWVAVLGRTPIMNKRSTFEAAAADIYEEAQRETNLGAYQSIEDAIYMLGCDYAGLSADDVNFVMIGAKTSANAAALNNRRNDLSLVFGNGRAEASPQSDCEARQEPPRPLMRMMPAAEPFPVGSLGSLLGDAARAINDRVRAPLAICANSVLATATLATQAHADVILPIGTDRQKPISAYFVTIAETGERKTECDFQAMWPVHQRERQLRDEYDAKRELYLNDKLAWDKARDGAVKQGKENRAAIKAALDKTGPPPMLPLEPMLTSTEPTWEGLCKQFVTHHPGLGIFTSEGGQFIGGHGMKDENKLRTATGLSGLWDGEPVRRVRAGDGATILPGRRLSGHIMAQPEVSSILFNDTLLRGQGLLSRLLVVQPESAVERECRAARSRRPRHN